jgi:hypothetical protein
MLFQVRRTLSSRNRYSWVTTMVVVSGICLNSGGWAAAQSNADNENVQPGTNAEDTQKDNTSPPTLEQALGGKALEKGEQEKKARQYVRQMRRTLNKIDTQAGSARDSRDFVKLGCVNDKLVQIKGNVRLGEQQYKDMNLADARGDDQARNHEFSKLTISHQKVNVLGIEAQSCIGKEASFVGTQKTEVDVDKRVKAHGDPTRSKIGKSPRGSGAGVGYREHRDGIVGSAMARDPLFSPST